jgi:hypothetical protein
MGIAIAAAAAAVAARAEWYDDMKVKGDVRYRFEHIDEEGKTSQQRDRVRARVGVFPRLGPNVDAGIQVATGEDKGNKESPTSSNATLTDGFSGKGIFLDLAYFDWHTLTGLGLQGGKIKNPFITVSDYVWDGDVNPEGLAVKYATGDEIQFLANGGYLWVYERKEDSDDAKMLGAQAALKLKTGDESHLLAGVSSYRHQNLEGYGPIDWSDEKKFYGNTSAKTVSGTTTNVLYATEYSLVEGFAEAQFDVGLPLVFHAACTVNTDADADDTAYTAGVLLGKAGDPKTFEVGYNYRRVEKDSALGAFTDSDSWGGGTDGRGHKLIGRYQLAKNWQFGVAYFLNDKKIEDSVDYKRLQVDLVAKF